MQEHGNSHATEKLYQCVYCLESFVWRASMDAHMKKAHSHEFDGEKATEQNDSVQKPTHPYNYNIEIKNVGT